MGIFTYLGENRGEIESNCLLGLFDFNLFSNSVLSHGAICFAEYAKMKSGILDFY